MSEPAQRPISNGTKNRLAEWRHLVSAAILLVLTLAGCSPPRAITREDGLQCEAKGFEPGSDPYIDCARGLEEERYRANELLAPVFK